MYNLRSYMKIHDPAGHKYRCSWCNQYFKIASVCPQKMNHELSAETPR